MIRSTSLESSLPPPSDEHARLVEEVIVPRLASGGLRVVIARAVGAAEEPASLLHRMPARYLAGHHAHDAYEICWVIDGACVLTVRNGALALDASTVCIVPPAEPHQLRPTPGLRHYRTVWWRVTRHGVVMNDGVFAGRRHAAFASFVELDVPTEPLLDRVMAEAARAAPHHGLFMRVGLLELAAHVLRALSRERAAGSTDHPAGAGDAPLEDTERTPDGNLHVRKALRFIQDRYADALTLGDVASAVGLSPGHLNALFRRQTARSVLAHVRDVRHREAQSLLRNTDLTVAEVARLVGHGDPYYFSRVFKMQERCTPLQYRRLFRPGDVGTGKSAVAGNRPGRSP